jgi:NAD(P)H-hydrate epimerase
VGLFTSTGSEYAKDVEVVDIGMPQELLESAQTGYTLVTSDVISHLFAERKKDSHKGDFGHVIVAGGSAGKMGAGLLACRAVLRSGAGLVTYALPDTAFAKFDTKSPEIMYEPLADKGKGFLTKDSAPQLKQLLAGKTAMVLGPGIGTQGETKTVVHDVLAKAVCPIVLDADGLNCVADKPSVISGRKVPIVITPHPGEMSRLTGEPTAKIQTSRMDTARQFAKAHGIIVVLKGFRSVIALPSGEIFINPTGGPAMATAGMGDVLSGVIAGFISQKIPVDMAVVAGVYIHGLAGDLSAKKVGERGLIASDVIANIPEAIKNIYEGGNKKSK